MTLDRTKTKQIGDWWFHMELLPFADARKLEPILIRGIGQLDLFLGDEDTTLMATISSLIPSDDVDRLLAAFLPRTQATDKPELHADRVTRLSLAKEEHCTEVFAGAGDILYDFLEWAVQENYGRLLGKARKAASQAGKRARERAAEIQQELAQKPADASQNPFRQASSPTRR